MASDDTGGIVIQNELQTTLNNILEDKNANLLPENLKAGVTCLGVEGIMRNGLEVKNFEGNEITLKDTANIKFLSNYLEGVIEQETGENLPSVANPSAVYGLGDSYNLFKPNSYMNIDNEYKYNISWGSGEIIVSSGKLRAGAYTAFLQLYQKPTQDSSFTGYVNDKTVSGMYFTQLDVENKYEPNTIYTNKFTVNEGDVVTYKIWGNANKDIIKFRLWLVNDTILNKSFIPYNSVTININDQNYILDFNDDSKLYDGEIPYIEDGKVYYDKKWNNLIITGNEFTASNAQIEILDSVIKVNLINILENALVIDENKIVTNLFISKYGDNSDTEHIRNGNSQYPNNLILYIDKSNLSSYDLEGIKALFNAKNLQVVYKITPIKTEITGELATQIKNYYNNAYAYSDTTNMKLNGYGKLGGSCLIGDISQLIPENNISYYSTNILNEDNLLRFSGNAAMGERIVIADGNNTIYSTDVAYDRLSTEIGLTSDKIVSGNTILGITGTAEAGIDTSDATASADDILQDKTAYVNGEKITGTIEVHTDGHLAMGTETAWPISYNIETNKVWISANSNKLYDIAFKGGGIQVQASVAGDAIATKINLTANKIIKGETVLGIEGTAETGSSEPIEPTYEYVTGENTETYISLALLHQPEFEHNGLWFKTITAYFAPNHGTVYKILCKNISYTGEIKAKICDINFYGADGSLYGTLGSTIDIPSQGNVTIISSSATTVYGIEASTLDIVIK